MSINDTRININNVINNYNNDNYNYTYNIAYNYRNVVVIDLIKCPFCRNQCNRDKWVQTTDIDTCNVCFEDGQLMCKSIECEHSLCVVCTNNIKCTYLPQ